jgi:translation initiation factor IF-3
MEGRQMVMVLSPKKKEVKLVKPKEAKPRVEKVSEEAAPAESDAGSVASTEAMTAEAGE